MSQFDEINQVSRNKAAAAAEAMREAARMVKVFEPTQINIDDEKRTAWNRTVTKIKDIYGLDATVLHPHASLDKYTVVSGGYIEGPVFIGNHEFSVGTRLNAFDGDEPGLQFEDNDVVVPYICPRGQYGIPVSEVYETLAEALDGYATTGAIHPEALGAPRDVPDTWDVAPATASTGPAKRPLIGRLFRKHL